MRPQLSDDAFHRPAHRVLIRAAGTWKRASSTRGRRSKVDVQSDAAPEGAALGTGRRRSGGRPWCGRHSSRLRPAFRKARSPVRAWARPAVARMFAPARFAQGLLSSNSRGFDELGRHAGRRGARFAHGLGRQSRPRFAQGLDRHSLRVGRRRARNLRADTSSSATIMLQHEGRCRGAGGRGRTWHDGVRLDREL